MYILWIYNYGYKVVFERGKCNLEIYLISNEIKKDWYFIVTCNKMISITCRLKPAVHGAFLSAGLLACTCTGDLSSS